MVQAQEAPDKQIVCVASQPAITRTIIVDVLSHHREPLYAIRNHESSNVWQAVCVVDDIRAFKTRKDFPAAWAGKSGEALVALTGVRDAIFCPNKLFLAVAGSKEGALALAKLALEA